jgi:hypothetical protein
VKALAALAVALGLIVAAVVVRNVLDEDDDADGSSAGGDTTLVCPTELADACAALEDDVTVRVEPAATTAEALATAADAAEADADVWLAPAAWAELVADQRDRAGAPVLVGEASAVIARSPVVLVVWSDRAVALESGACAGTIGWRCLGDAADRPWGSVGGESAWGPLNVGLTDPDTAGGLVVLGGAASGFFGSPEYAANDIGGELTAWLGAIGAQAGTASSDVVNEMLTRGAGRFSAVGALEADTPAGIADRGDVQVIYPAPVATADLVAIPIGDAAGAAADIAGDGDLRDALAGAGWRVGGEDLPEDDGLPAGGVLGALLARWDEVTG